MIITRKTCLLLERPSACGNWSCTWLLGICFGLFVHLYWNFDLSLLDPWSFRNAQFSRRYTLFRKWVALPSPALLCWSLLWNCGWQTLGSVVNQIAQLTLTSHQADRDQHTARKSVSMCGVSVLAVPWLDEVWPRAEGDEDLVLALEQLVQEAGTEPLSKSSISHGFLEIFTREIS